ncbi:hypothetical protein VUJ49_06100 [Pseudomonas berkeleyensis]|uniref:Uncharacterized protein n=1 Tax=Pseudomonas berkeleyensis TaxID=2726956 RepID=A0A7G5DSA4_9PSED|nr:hypothetical protein [Pseudomonas berkeleyensis]QMV64629.1 hypothetical protein HS968_06085 [Pseudomonas berkeleyensis]WSO40096.1 hypothetical protein VUJ49_06100 [Pseudomonas berkeleyensis]
MNSYGLTLDASNAFGYIGQTVLVELAWDGEPHSFWYCLHIVGVVLPIPGLYEQGYFLTLKMDGEDQFPNEVFFTNIRTIRAMRYRDRHGSGNVLGRMTLTHSAGSGAALPARRNSFTVPANGSTGAAHP